MYWFLSNYRDLIFLCCIPIVYLNIFLRVTVNLSLRATLPSKRENRNEIRSFSAAFFVLVPSSCWLFQNLSCKKKIVSYYSIWSYNLSRMHAGEWWIRWVRNRPTHERTVRSSAMCYTYPCVRTHHESGIEWILSLMVD